MFDHSDSIRDILQNAKEELKSSDDLREEYDKFNQKIKSDNNVNDDGSLVLRNPLEKHSTEKSLGRLKQINDSILHLTNEVKNNENILLLNEEISNEENLEENVLYLNDEYKPEFSKTLVLSQEIDLDQPLLLNSEFEETIQDLSSELSTLEQDLDGPDPIYERVDIIDQQQTNIQNKLETIYEKIEDNDTDTDLKLDKLSSDIESKISENIIDIKKDILEIKNDKSIIESLEHSISIHLDPINQSFLTYKDDLNNIHESIVHENKEVRDIIVQSNENLKKDITESNEHLKQDITESNEHLKQEILLDSEKTRIDNENLKNEILDNLRIFEEERRRIEEERIAKENSPQRKLEKRFKEISEVLESQNLKMQTIYSSIEMQHNQTIMQNVMNNFMQNIQNYEKKLEDKMDQVENKFTKPQSLNFDETIFNLEKRIDNKIDKVLELTTNQFSKNTVAASTGASLENYKNFSENAEIIKHHIDRKFNVLEDMIKEVARFTQSMKENSSEVAGKLSSEAVQDLKSAIESTIKSEIGSINSKLLKFDDWVQLLQEQNFDEVNVHDLEKIEKFKDIEEVKEFISKEILEKTQNWIKLNKKKIDELAKNLLV